MSCRLVEVEARGWRLEAGGWCLEGAGGLGAGGWRLEVRLWTCRLASSSRAEEGYMTPSGLSHRSRAKMTDWIIDSRWLEVGLGQAWGQGWG